MRPSRLLPWSILLSVVLTAGCLFGPDDEDKTTPTPPPPPPPPPPTPAVIRFALDDDEPVLVQLDGQNLGTLESRGQVVQRQVPTGSHAYEFQHLALGFRSPSQTVSVTSGETRTITIKDIPWIVPPPTDLTASDGAYFDRIALRWTAPPATATPKYEIQWRPKTATDWQLLTRTSSTSFEHVNGISAGTKYVYRVRAYWSDGPESPFSNEDEGYVRPRSVSFSRLWNTINTTWKRIYLHADLRVVGYRGTTHAVGGYWLMKTGDLYYFVRSGCDLVTPNDYLGHLWNITPGNDDTQYTDLWFSLGYSCFPDRSDGATYYGVFMLYSGPVSSVTNPNLGIMASIGPPSVIVKIWWSSSTTYPPALMCEVLEPGGAEHREVMQQIERVEDSVGGPVTVEPQCSVSR